MKLTASLRREITADWQPCFPGLGIYHAMWLGRLVGPFFQGVCLEESSAGSSYWPTTHIHFLGINFPVVSLTLAQRLQSSGGVDDSITIKFHKQKYVSAAERLRAASLLPVAGQWGLRDLTIATESFQRLGRSDAKYPAALFEANVLAAVWIGDKNQAQKLLSNYEISSAAWPENILAQRNARSAAIDDLRRFIEDPRQLADLVQKNMDGLGLRALPFVHLSGGVS